MAQEEFSDHLAEKKNVADFIRGGNRRICFSKKGKNVLDPSMLCRIVKKLGEATARRDVLELGLNNCQKKCKIARKAVGGEETVSNACDPPDWKTATFPQKRNQWVLPDGEDEEEEAANRVVAPKTRSTTRTAVISEPLLKKLRTAQEEYWDHVYEMKNAKDCIDSGRYMVRMSNNKTRVLDSSVLLKINARMEKAMACVNILELGLNKCVRKCE